MKAKMKINKETFTETGEFDEWYSNGYNRNEKLIWSLHFHHDSDIHNTRIYKSFTTYKYDEKGNLIEKLVEELDWEKELEWNNNLWNLNSITKYEYIEHEFGDQLKVKETEFFVENYKPRKIFHNGGNVIAPDPLYPDEINYVVKGKKNEIEIDWAGNLFESYIKTTNFDVNGKISSVKEKIHNQEDLDVCVSYKMNNKLYKEEKYYYDDIISSILLINEKKWIEDEYNNYSSSTTYKYDEHDKLVKSIQVDSYYDDDYIEDLELRKTIAISYLNGRPVKKKEENIKETDFTEFDYNSNGQLTSFTLSKINSGFKKYQGKKYQVFIKYESEELVLMQLHFFDPNDNIKFDLSDFIDLPHIYYSLDVFSERIFRNDYDMESINRYLESNRLNLSIKYEYGYISEIVLADDKTGKTLKKNIFLNNFTFDEKGNPFIKSITGLNINQDFETYVLFSHSFEYFIE